MLHFSFPGTASADESYVDELVRKAESRHLAADRYWQILLHYKPRLNGGERSLIDDPKFFLAPDGKEHPEKELEATLRGFFLPQTGDGSPRCRFPARFAWLSERLDIDAGSLPAASCPEMEAAIAAADPKAAVLVFPAAHMNSPASMFGHTFLRIDNSYKSELLAYAVNYAAQTDETNGFAYALKGVFGLYNGYFSILPYYAKVKEYNDMEHRDMWEYSLNLSEDETRRMALHIWELRDVSSKYYFFDENCSYNLLFLLEAARPTANLTDRMGMWVIPTDTVRVVREEGLIARVKYRPSQATRIRRIAATLTEEELLAATSLANDDQRTVSAQTATKGTLDLAAELLQYRYAREELDKESFNRKFLSLLKRRSTLGPTKADEYPSKPLPPVEEGHRTSTMGIATGYRKQDLFTEIFGRLAYHDLLDADAGYLPGAQINFFDTRIRYYPQAGTVHLQRLRLIDIISLSPRDEIFHPVSWKVTVGAEQELHRDGDDHLIFRLNTGGGFSHAIGETGLAYILGEMDLVAGDRLKWKSALGGGASIGFLVEPASFWKAQLSVRGLYYPLGDQHAQFKGELAQNFRLGRDDGLGLTVSAERSFDRDKLELRLAWNHFF